MAAPVIRYRSIWISDLHLGTRACKADALLDFLRHHRAEYLYLVGDIVDGWNLGRSWYWNAQQNDAALEIVRWMREGARVVFIPGNHDEGNLDLVRLLFGEIAIQQELIHRTADGSRMLVTHGHQFDIVRRSANWLSMIGSQAYTVALRINEWHSRERFNLSERSLSGYLKRPVKKAVGLLAASDLDEQALLRAVMAKKADGIICGHTHRAEQRLIDSIWYLNDGDWVLNCTALAERADGTLRLLRWIPDPARGGESQLAAQEMS
ncbi:MAG TPA: UDP-2,3-diacylglucosamine diphosphatase [Candidatus Binataceae bacterium]|nr:UDP-2,3-diacylglucosamine diphosphatase [Candidatus Binataceae bacterium]